MKKNLLLPVLAVMLLSVSFVAAAAPTLSNVSAVPSETTARISWNVNQTGYNNTVRYGLTSSLGSTATNTTNGTAPQITLTGLTDGNTLYYYKVQSCDNASACTNGTLSTFRTLYDCDSTDNAIDCDVIEGMPAAGSNLGSFLANIAPGVGLFMLLLGLFGGIVAILYAIVGRMTKKLK